MESSAPACGQADNTGIPDGVTVPERDQNCESFRFETFIIEHIVEPMNGEMDALAFRRPDFLFRAA